MRELALMTGFAVGGYEWLVIAVFLACVALVLYVVTRNRR